MKISKVILLLVIFSHKVHAQSIDSAKFDQLMNKEYLPYKNRENKFLGCGYTYECNEMQVVFYEITLLRKQKKLIIKGRAIDPIPKKDSFGVQGVNIFLATPIKNELTKINSATNTYVRYKSDSHKNQYPYRDGDFYIETVFSLKERLYFNSAVFRPIEYNIGQLLIK
ncbi:MAG: hypothetical protein ABJA32_08995 [Ginsengibacter sp.]